AARGMAVRVFGPAETGRRYFPGLQDPAAGRTGGAPGQPPRFTAVAIGDRPRPGRDLAAVLRLRRLLRDWSPDVVHAHGLRAGAVAALALLGGGPGPVQPGGICGLAGGGAGLLAGRGGAAGQVASGGAGG